MTIPLMAPRIEICFYDRASQQMPRPNSGALCRGDTDDIAINLCVASGGPSPDDVAEIILVADQIKIDLRPRFELTLANCGDTLDDDIVAALQFRLDNDGWGEAHCVDLELCGPAAELFVEQARRFRCRLASGESRKFILEHRHVDRNVLDRLHDAYFENREPGANARFEQAYQQELSRLRRPAENLNETRLKNYIKMTGLGKKWVYDPVPVLPVDSPELRASFRQTWYKEQAAGASPRLFPQFRWIIVEPGCDPGQPITGLIEPMDTDVKIVVDDHAFRIATRRGYSGPTGSQMHRFGIDTSKQRNLLNLGATKLPDRMKSPRWSSDLFWPRMSVELYADRSCWARIGACTILNDGSCVDSLPVMVHVSARASAVR